MAQTRLEQMLEQREKLEARIRDARGREAALEKRQELRRKVLAGAYMHRIAGGDWSKVGEELATEGLLDEAGRQLFKLPRRS